MEETGAYTQAGALLRRAELCLEDGAWAEAAVHCNHALNLEPENAKAYVCLLQAELHIGKEQELIHSPIPLPAHRHFQKAVRFAGENYAETLWNYARENAYLKADTLYRSAQQASEYREAAAVFAQIRGYRDAGQREESCLDAAKRVESRENYDRAMNLLRSDSIVDVKTARKIFAESSCGDAARRVTECDEKAAWLAGKEEASRRRRRLIIFGTVIGIVVLTLGILISASSRNERLAGEIQWNFQGMTFEGSSEDDDGFSSDYYSKSLNPYSIYWLTTEEVTLSFQLDGSVEYLVVSDMTALAWPSATSEPEGYHSSYDGNYDSFDVQVTLSGDVYLILGGKKYMIGVDSENEPYAIYGYHDMTLR